jgi:SOS-response transcriptional repressor LexA
MPLISWVRAGQWNDVVDVYRPGEGEKPVYTTRKVGSRAYALRVVGDSMENPNGRPTYPQGSIIIVDPDREPIHGSPVIVRLEDSKQATFKQLVIEGGVRYLKPLNPRYPIMKVARKASFCGVVVQTIIDED